MNKNLTVVLALVAGLLGGLLTHYVVPPAAFAQDQTPPITKEIRAQSFTLVDASGRTAGMFTTEPVPGATGPFLHLRQNPQSPNNQFVPEGPVPMRIVLRDSNGREIWSAGGSVIRPLSER
jgi:hypothetical protein